MARPVDANEEHEETVKGEQRASWEVSQEGDGEKGW